MIIRPETVADYAGIADVQVRAFGHRPGEALIVALHRQRGAFDPELSLVAEVDGRVVGHVLFSPHQMRLLGQTIPVVNLAPIAIDPELALPIHPAAAATSFVNPCCEAWDSAMACNLAPSPLDDYFAQMQAGHRLPGRPTWPVAFDLD